MRSKSSREMVGSESDISMPPRVRAGQRRMGQQRCLFCLLFTPPEKCHGLLTLSCAQLLVSWPLAPMQSVARTSGLPHGHWALAATRGKKGQWVRACMGFLSYLAEKVHTTTQRWKMRGTDPRNGIEKTVVVYVGDGMQSAGRMEKEGLRCHLMVSPKQVRVRSTTIG